LVRQKRGERQDGRTGGLGLVLRQLLPPYEVAGLCRRS
jgi:hypothetical protein